MGSGARLRAPEPPSPEAARSNRRGEPRAPSPGKPASLGPSRRAFQPSTREQADPTSFHLGCWGGEGGGSPARDLGTGTQEGRRYRKTRGRQVRRGRREGGAEGKSAQRRGRGEGRGVEGERGAEVSGRREGGARTHLQAAWAPAAGSRGRGSLGTHRPPLGGPALRGPAPASHGPGRRVPRPCRRAQRSGWAPARRAAGWGVPSSAPERRPGPAPGRRGARRRRLGVGAGGTPGGGGGGGVWRLRTPAPGSSAPPGLRPLPTPAPRRI